MKSPRCASSPGPRLPPSAPNDSPRRRRPGCRRRRRPTLFSTPSITSSSSTAPRICDQNWPGSTPMSCTPTSCAPKRPIMLKIAASSGIEITPPRNRGITTRRTGSTAIISIAASWSVARISPSSEASAVPARPANSRAVMTGPSSFRSPSAAADAERLLGTEALEQVEALQAEHHADEQAGQHDDHERQRAGVVHLLDHEAEAPQRARRLAREAAGEERVARRAPAAIRGRSRPARGSRARPFSAPAGPVRRIPAPDSGTAPDRRAVRA